MQAPPGWRELSDDEIIIEGDKYWSRTHGQWRLCNSSIGGTVRNEFSDGNPVIRKSGPEPEKEWLNPWD